ncbi:MAG: S41 family peptidase [Bacteroidota bacterium]
MNKILLLLTIVTSLSACEKAILGLETENTPINNFELFWKTYDEHSSIIFPKQINWDSVYQVYRPSVSNATSEEELWTIFTEMIEVFDDEHTLLYDPIADRTYVSGSQGIDVAMQSFSKTLLDEKYLEYRTIIETAPDFSYGKIKDKSIGYIYIGDSDGNHPEQTIDEILEVLGELEAIIVDVRNNGGGSTNFMKPIANAFATEDRLAYTVQERIGVNYDDFSEPLAVYTTYDGVNQYTKPVILLTDRFSVSAAEDFTLHMKVIGQVTHIGDTTAGAFSLTSPQQFLPNGWTYQYPVQMELTPEGVCLEGIGVIPEIAVENTPQNIENQEDKIIERAIRYLFETYGIR